MLALLMALALPARAGNVAYTAALTLDADSRLRVVETARPVGGTLDFCGPQSRELPAKRLRLDGLRRLVRLRVAGAFRGLGAGLRPVPWTLERTRRGAALRAAAAPAPPDCALTLLYEEEALLSPAPAGARLLFPLPVADWGMTLESGMVSLAGTEAPVRLVAVQGGAEKPLAAGKGQAALPRPTTPKERILFEAEVPAPPVKDAGGRLLADNLHVAVGAAGFALLVLLYLLMPASASADGRPWLLLAYGGALSAGTVAAMRLAEDPASIGAAAAGWALLAGLGAGLAGALTLALWAATAVLLRSASRPGAQRPAVLGLAGAACGFASFGVTTAAADALTRLVRDAAPAVVAAGAAHLLAHAAAFRLRRSNS